MCESTAYLQQRGTRNKLMEDVAKLQVTASGVRLYDMLGNMKEVRGGRVAEINFTEHAIILVKD